jgi:uncharacterized sulfatase
MLERNARTILAYVVTVLCVFVLPAQAQPSRPNVVVILADDLGYGDIGVNGASLIRTPNLDRMSSEGVRLTSFYSSANICTPARGGLLTGRYPIRLGLALDVSRPSNDIGISDDEVTLGEAFQGLGYRTALFGTWHLGEEPERSPLRHGFDEFYGLLHSNDMLPLALYRGDQIVEEVVNQATLTERYTEEAVRFIEDNVDSPFLLYLPHTFPHVPLHASGRFEGQSDAGLYGDVVEELDWSVGRVLSALRRLGLDDRTLVIFTSDNGPWWEGSAGPYRERKGTAWEGGLRVPFVARWPGVIPGGGVSEAPAMNIDIFPTLVTPAGGTLPTDRTIDGRDILPMLRGNAPSPHEALFLFDRDRIAGVRSGRWKLVVESKYQASVTRLDHPSSYYGPGLLFDLQRDPSETYSYAREHPEIVRQLRQRLERARRELGATVLDRMWNR